MDALRGLSELGLGSRMKRTSEHIMKEVQLVYDYFNMDFDPYLFPIVKIIDHKNGVTNAELKTALLLSQPAITQAINKLSSKGLIIIENDTSDKRKKIIHLSNKGIQLISQMKPLWKVIDSIVKDYTSHPSNSLVEHLNKLEDKLNAQKFSEVIISKAKLNTNNSIEIISYDNKYAKDFYALNVEWLKTFFYIEPYDEEVLSKPKRYIINKGGHIFFAIENNTVLGTVALMPLKEPNVFELTKMAVSPNQRGKKIGQQLMQHCIDFAKSQGFPKLILYSNTKLENAIYIYRKYGFIEIPVEPNCPYVRSDIKMEIIID